MKIMIMPSSIEEIKYSLNYVDAYVIGIRNMSVNCNMDVDIEDLNKIKSIIGDKDLFICLNKNMENSDISNLSKIMIELNDYNITGIFYYDVAVVSLSQSLNLNYELVWANEHASTNYSTINYWHDFGVNYCLISSDITINEIIEIKQNTEANLIVPIFGYQSMFTSKRHIVNNYLDYFDLKDDSDINYIEKEGKVYPITDSELGTVVYTNNILNGIKEYNNLKDNKITYVLLNSFNIDSDKFKDVLKTIKNINDDNVIKSYEHINSLFSNVDSGFLYKETIARVKKNDK